MAGNLSFVPRLVRAILGTGEGLETSAIANFFRRIFPTSLAVDVTSEIAEDDWVLGTGKSLSLQGPLVGEQEYMV